MLFTKPPDKREGYIYAKVAGEYSIALNRVDDIVFAWVGGKAYEGWTRDNADGILGYQAGYVQVVKFTLAAGDHVPFRLLFVNGQTYNELDVAIYAPNNDVIADSNGIDTDYIVARTCSGIAPDFPDFPPTLDPEYLVRPYPYS